MSMPQIVTQDMLNNRTTDSVVHALMPYRHDRNNYLKETLHEKPVSRQYPKKPNATIKPDILALTVMSAVITQTKTTSKDLKNQTVT
jgi:hypothetical protein